jgi:hypothetical protein
VPVLPMITLDEREAFLAIMSVLCEPDPAREDERRKLRPGLERQFDDAGVEHYWRAGDAARVAGFIARTIGKPYPTSAALAWRKSSGGIKLAHHIYWFLYSAVERGDDKKATVTAACEWWVARNMPGQDSSERRRYVQSLWRRHRPAAHLCAAFHAFQADRATGYIKMLAVAEALLDRLEVRRGTAPQPLLQRSSAWVVPETLGLKPADLSLSVDPEWFARLSYPQVCNSTGE